MADPADDRDADDDATAEPDPETRESTDSGPSASESADSSPGASESAGSDTPGTESAEVPCPECDEPIPAGARFCPHCRTVLADDDDAVDLSDLDGLFDGDDQPDVLALQGGRDRRASGHIRTVSGLAVSVPLAPLGLFLVGTVLPLTVWTASLVFLGSWLVPAAYLARAPVPAEAFARSLYLIAAGTALIPVALRVGDTDAANGGLAVTGGMVTLAALTVAGLAALLGVYMHRQAKGRVAGELRAVESPREE